MNKFINKTINLPIPIVGSTLALCTIANAYSILFNLEIVRTLAMTVGIIIFSLYSVKIICNFDTVKNEYKSNTVIACLYATYSMLLMNISSFIVEFNKPLGVTLWYISIIIHIGFILGLIFFHILKQRSLSVVFPSWYVPFVGIVVAVVIGKNMPNELLKQVIVIWGFFIYFATILLVIYRLISLAIPEQARHTKAILIAPISLIIVGYLTTFGKQNANQLLVTTLYIILIITIIFVLSQARDFFKNGFEPTFGSLTFPMAISVIALIRVDKLFSTNSNMLSFTVKPLLYFQLFAATLITCYTLYMLVKKFLF